LKKPSESDPRSTPEDSNPCIVIERQGKRAVFVRHVTAGRDDDSLDLRLPHDILSTWCDDERRRISRATHPLSAEIWSTARKDFVEQTVASWLSDFGAPVLFALLAVGVVGLPLPDETLLTFAGVLVAQGRMNPATAAAAAIGGAMTGITLSYGVGRFAGLPLLLR
jgi:hypothetical protein